MSLMDTMTDVDVSSLQRKNAILRETLEAQGILNTKLKKMLDVAIGRIVPYTEDEYTKTTIAQNVFRELEGSVDMSADAVHPGKPEATANESGQLDG